MYPWKTQRNITSLAFCISWRDTHCKQEPSSRIASYIYVAVGETNKHNTITFISLNNLVTCGDCIIPPGFLWHYYLDYVDTDTGHDLSTEV